MARNREYELRFTLDQEDEERFVSHPLVAPSRGQRQTGRLVSTYFDTPDGALQRHRFGLRVRQAGNKMTHTLKHTGGSLVDRGEWECANDDSKPNVVWLRDTPLERLLRDASLETSLGPRFSVDVTRTIFPLRHRKATIEVALDQGTIGADGVSLPLHEVELELKRGKPDAILFLSRKLVRDLPLVLSLASKSERGYGLSDLTWGRPTDTITPRLDKRMTIAQSFEAIMQTCLHVFLKNAALMETGSMAAADDGEALHSARIALRHLRAACQLFRPVLRRKRFAALRPEIKWLSDKLGAARDADVFQSTFYDPAARDDGTPAAEALARLMGEHRRRSHEKLRRALNSSRARLLFLDLLAFSMDGVRRGMTTKRCRPFARKSLVARRRALVKQARNLAHQPVAEMHEVRKSAKMLRYDLDLLATLPKLDKGKALRRLGRNLRTIQKSLGALNDEEAMRAHLRRKVLARGRNPKSLSTERRNAMSAAAGLVSRERTHDHQLRKAEKAARAL